jgi:hypothetical protein
MKKKLVNTLKQFIETTNDRRLSEYVRRNGNSDGFEHFTSYRLAKDCSISLNTVYNLVNHPDRIPSERVLKKISELYLAQPSELLSLVDDSDAN